MKTNFLAPGSEQSHNFAVYIGLAMVAFCIVSFTIARSNVQKVLTLRSALKAKKSSLERLNTKIEYLRSLDRAALADRVTKVENVFPSEKPVMNLINSLKSTALEQQVSIGGITLNPGQLTKKKKKTAPPETAPVSASGLQQFTLSVTIQGATENVFGYIDRLNRTSPLVTIDTLSLQSFSRNLQDAVSATISVTVFYQAPPETIGPIDAPVEILSSDDLGVLEVLDEYVVYPVIQPRLTETTVYHENFFAPQ